MASVPSEQGVAGIGQALNLDGQAVVAIPESERRAMVRTQSVRTPFAGVLQGLRRQGVQAPHRRHHAQTAGPTGPRRVERTMPAAWLGRFIGEAGDGRLNLGDSAHARAYLVGRARTRLSRLTPKISGPGRHRHDDTEDSGRGPLQRPVRHHGTARCNRVLLATWVIFDTPAYQISFSSQNRHGERLEAIQQHTRSEQNRRTCQEGHPDMSP